MCFFKRYSDKRQVFDGLRGSPSRGCATQLNIVEKMAGGRQEPQNREAGRRKDGTTHDPRTPRKGRLRPVKLQLIQPCCSFHLLPFLVYRNRHLCRGHNCRQNLRFAARVQVCTQNSSRCGRKRERKGENVPPRSRPLCSQTQFTPNVAGSLLVEEDVSELQPRLKVRPSRSETDPELPWRTPHALD